MRCSYFVNSSLSQMIVKERCINIYSYLLFHVHRKGTVGNGTFLLKAGWWRRKRLSMPPLVHAGRCYICTYFDWCKNWFHVVSFTSTGDLECIDKVVLKGRQKMSSDFSNVLQNFIWQILSLGIYSDQDKQFGGNGVVWELSWGWDYDLILLMSLLTRCILLKTLEGYIVPFKNNCF